VRYSFVFVCQAGELELKAMLLAASLRRNLRSDHQLVAAVPTPEARWGRPRPETLRFLGELGVDVVPITNEIDSDYPIGNKVSCLLVDLAGDVTVFVDTDMLCLRPFAHFPEFDAAFCAKPADFYSFRDHNENDEMWEKVYGTFDLAVPRVRMTATVSGESMPPYFNAGFVAARRGTGLGQAWLACCRRIDANDEIALPVAVAQLGLEYRCLDERFNYPCHERRIDRRDPPIFAHYHWPTVVLRDPVLREHCKALAREHRALADALDSYPRWRWLRYPSPVIACGASRWVFDDIGRVTLRSARRFWRAVRARQGAGTARMRA
jgi:hypothetical protein